MTRNPSRVLLAAMMAAGCATASHPTLHQRLTRLAPGMTKSQVVELLGPPVQAATGRVYEGPSVTAPGFSEVHRYLEVRRGRTNDAVVVFRQGKLTEFGPYVGSLRARYDVFEP